MARPGSKMKAGYLPIEPHHYAALLSLVNPATTQYRLLDPFAGEGAFLAAAASAWRMTPYACELDQTRAQACIERFGPTQAVQGDAERLRASTGAFSLGWFNPPYDHDSAAEHKRVEFRLLRHGWKWVQDGGLVLWVVYRQHLTEKAAAFFAKHSSRVDVWALPGKHQGEFDQIVVSAIKTDDRPSEAQQAALYESILAQKARPHPLEVQPEPIYTLPDPPQVQRFVFAPDNIDEQQGLQLLESHGAWRSAAFQHLLQPPTKLDRSEPIVAPRPGHMALVLAAGIADGAVIDTAEYGRAALRSKTRHIDEIARTEAQDNPADPDHPITKKVHRRRPSTRTTLLTESGQQVILEGDEPLLGFITANQTALSDYLNRCFTPLYDFNFNGLGGWLSGLRLKGKYPLYVPQKHVVGAITRGLEQRRGLMLIGQMGTGKTAMASSAAIAIARGLVENLRGQMQPGQVTLIICPSHLVEKWKRELLSLDPLLHIEHLKRHEDVKAFMAEAQRRGGITPSIGLIKTNMTKLGSGWSPAVVWRKVRRGGEVVRQPHCPHCGEVIIQKTRDDRPMPATEHWLKGGRRTCKVCQTPLWQEARDSASAPKPGQKYPPKPPRYRLDEYLKRHYPNRVFLTCWDEIHEAKNGDSGNGEAFTRLANLSQKLLVMTGTPTNGRASSTYNAEFMLNPDVRRKYPRPGAARLTRKERGGRTFQQKAATENSPAYDSRTRWVEDMGVLESIEEERPEYDRQTGIYTGTSSKQQPYQEAPGISPLLIASMLDHAIFFSLGDLGKALPEYRETAMPIPPDDDLADRYEQVQDDLKEYLRERLFDGDNSFRGAYLQWALRWPNAPWRDTQVVHNIRCPITQQKRPYTVASITAEADQTINADLVDDDHPPPTPRVSIVNPALVDPDRIFNKEQALIELVGKQLSDGRPCVVYLAQTASRDIQPRLKMLLETHVPSCNAHILTADSERREARIEAEIAAGCNVLITHPKKVATGLDLLHFPTLVFYEPLYQLDVMLQAASRSYRLNQTNSLCEVYYLFYEGFVEHAAIQLMSRKQRASKLLTGELGMTGLDALTQGEDNFESALLDAIAKNDALLDATELFRKDTADTQDAAFWQVENETAQEEATESDSLLRYAERELGAVVVERRIAAETLPSPTTGGTLPVPDDQELKLREGLAPFMSDNAAWDAVLTTLLNGETSDDGIKRVVGLSDEAFTQSPLHEDKLYRWLRSYLKRHKLVPAADANTTAKTMITTAKSALGLAAPEPTPPPKPQKKRKLDMNAAPADEAPIPVDDWPQRVPVPAASAEPVQLTLL
jgi:16S rRNA G966 N2-methylase RsmD